MILPGADQSRSEICGAAAGGSAILIVPSLVAPIESHILINPEHPETRAITHGLHRPVWWDERLYRSNPATP